MLDSRYTILTPEGVELPIHVAGIPARALAWFIDAIVVGVLFFIFFIIAALLKLSSSSKNFENEAAIGLMLIVFFIINWSYDVVCEVWLGGTPGKRALKLKVIHSNGTPVGLKASFIRNILRSADIFPFLYALGIIVMTFNDRFQRIGDVLAGTVVIYLNQPIVGQPIADLPPIPVPSQLSYEDRQTILLFAERYPTLSPQRSAELAQHLAFLVPEQDGDPIPTLLGYANWLIRG